MTDKGDIRKAAEAALAARSVATPHAQGWRAQQQHRRPPPQARKAKETA